MHHTRDLEGRRHEAREATRRRDWTRDFDAVRDLMNWLLEEGLIVDSDVKHLINAPHQYSDRWQRFQRCLSESEAA